MKSHNLNPDDFIGARLRKDFYLSLIFAFGQSPIYFFKLFNMNVVVNVIFFSTLLVVTD